MLSSCYINKKNDIPNEKKILVLYYKTSRVLEGMNSSLAQSAGELWSDIIYPGSAFVVVVLLPIFNFWAINVA